MRRSRWILLLIVAAVVVVSAVMASRGNGGVTAVATEPVTRQAVLRSTVTASGEIVATRYADIGSSAMGRIVSLRVSEGEAVKSGQVLAVIDPVQARAELAAARSLVDALSAEAAAAEEQVRGARADEAFALARLKEAQLNLERTKNLFSEALTPRSNLDAAEASYETARAQVASAQAVIQRAENARTAATRRIAQARAQAARSQDVVSKTEIAAPIDGIVSRLQVREGEMVVIGIQNQPGTTLMTLSDLSEIDAEVKAAEADVLRLKLGQPATVALEAVPGRHFTGRVVEVGASALPVVGTVAAAREFRVVVRLDQPDPSLRPGLTCDAEILTDEKANATTVPLQAVVLRPATDAGGSERPGVFVVDGERVRFRAVTTGIIGGLNIEVNGVAEGTKVVTGPYQALRDLQDGSRIRVQQP